MREVAGYIILFVFIIVFVVLSYFSTSFYRFVKVLKWTLCQVSVASMLNFSVLLAHLPNTHNLLRKRRIGIVFLNRSFSCLKWILFYVSNRKKLISFKYATSAWLILFKFSSNSIFIICILSFICFSCEELLMKSVRQEW